MSVSKYTCLWCGIKFPGWPRAKYCSLRCAIDSRILVRGEDECWPWQGSTNGKHYGVIKIRPLFGSQSREVHRIAYQLHVGPIPEGKVVRHSCDNPICCNYKKHLLVGTHKDNTQDAVSRNRMASGDSHGRRKLTAEQVRIVRQMPFVIIQKQEVAELLRVSAKYLSELSKGRHWRRINAGVPS